MSSTFRRLAPVAAVLAVAAGCGAGGQDDSEPSASPSDSASPAPATIDAAQIACRLLTTADRTRLAGVPVDEIVAASGAGGGSQCRWQSADALVQITTLPAKQWAKSLPKVVEQLESSSDVSSAADRKDLVAAKKLLSGAATFTDEQACAAFTTLAELGGEAKGATTTVTSIPITETESGISGQACSGGVLTSVLYSVPGLKESAAIDRAVTSVLDAAHTRLARLS